MATGSHCTFLLSYIKHDLAKKNDPFLNCIKMFTEKFLFFVDKLFFINVNACAMN